MMAFPLNTPYYQIPGDFASRPPEAVFGAVVQMLLKARIRLHLDKASRFSDEDVTAYLGGLLVSYINPVYLCSIARVVFPYDIDLFQAVSKAEDQENYYQAYWIYKVNADDLLVSLGIFRPRGAWAKGQIGRVRRYYTSASACQRRIYRRPTAVAEIHAKLSEGVERYLTILDETRSQYMHYLNHFQSEEGISLGQQLHQFEQEFALKLVQDELLDLYSGWLKGAKDPAVRQRLLQLVDRLKTLDPSFQPNLLLGHLDNNP